MAAFKPPQAKNANSELEHRTAKSVIVASAIAAERNHSPKCRPHLLDGSVGEFSQQYARLCDFLTGGRLEPPA